MELLLSDNPAIGFIGFGHMGAAIGQAIHQKHPSNLLFVVESNTDRQAWISDHCPFVTLVDYERLFSECNLVFLAIKPQQIGELSTQIKPFLNAEHTLISMLAGVPLEASLALFLPANIVRIMPNTPVKLSKGVTGIYFSPRTDVREKDVILNLCESFGRTLPLDNEDHLNVITALSGSGPAFFYRMVEACVSFGVSSGLDKKMALEAVIHTMIGAGHMLLEDPDPTEQNKRVTSPNGTTQAGLGVMDQQDFDTLIESVLTGAYDRAIELSKETI